MPTDTSSQSDPPPPLEPPAKLVLFLDECIPGQLAERLLSALHGHPQRPEIKYITDYYRRQGVADSVWIDEIVKHHWLPITADRGKRGPGQSLPRLMRERNIIHISLSAKVHNLKPPEKTEAIVACWSRIVHVWQNKIGCCHRIQFDSHRKYFRLEQKS